MVISDWRPNHTRLGRTTKIYISLDASNHTWTNPGNKQTQELIIPTLDTAQLQVYGPNTNSGDDTSDEKTRPTLATEQQEGDHESDSGSDNDTGRRTVTRARGRQNGIIHTALLFSYLDNPGN